MLTQPACKRPGLLRGEWHAAQVSHIIAPAVLAVYALNLSRISVMDTATLLFGYFLAEKLEPPSLFWGYVATLVAAVFYGYGALLAASPVHDLPCVAPGEPCSPPPEHCIPAPLPAQHHLHADMPWQTLVRRVLAVLSIVL